MSFSFRSREEADVGALFAAWPEDMADCGDGGAGRVAVLLLVLFLPRTC